MITVDGVTESPYDLRAIADDRKGARANTTPLLRCAVLQNGADALRANGLVTRNRPIRCNKIYAGYSVLHNLKTGKGKERYYDTID